MMRKPFFLSIPLLLLGFGQSAFAQKLGTGGGTDISIWRVVLSLLLCLGLAAGAAFALRLRLRGGSPIPIKTSRRVEPIERLRLSHQTDLHLIRCDGHEFLITTSPHGTRFGPEIQSSGTEPTE